ncbi:MAG: hypothetical protein KIT83_02490 [Bryobacterales bacterium]|nr:hypothetical protein [Bryobacterales bacterium]
MSLNINSARSFNNGRGYSVNAIRAMQRQMGISVTGSFDDGTLRGVFNWQGSSDRMASLVPDGKFGQNSLGCLVAEMRRGSPTTDLSELAAYPHNLPTGSGPSESAVVSSFTVTDPVLVALRGDGAGWQFRGRFRVYIRFNNGLANVNRYQYRQYIRGTAIITPGRFTGNPPSLGNWSATGAPQDASAEFRVPGGLRPSDWSEDGIVAFGATRKYGYRSSNAFIAPGEEDRYLPDQQNGKEYICIDTFGMMGSRRVSGSRLRMNLHYKGVIVDVLNNNRVVKQKAWTYVAEDIMT